MRILVFGAGVIGTVCAWQPALAGNAVTPLVRPGRGEGLRRNGIRIEHRDNRGGVFLPGGGRRPATTTHRPAVVEALAAADLRDPIVACVRRNQCGASGSARPCPCWPKPRIIR